MSQATYMRKSFFGFANTIYEEKFMKKSAILLAAIALCLSASAVAKPDLTVRDIRLVKGCKIKVTVANIGKTGVPKSAYNLPKAAGVQMYRNGKPWGGIILKGFDPAGKLRKPRSSASHIWFPRAKNLQLKPGIHQIKVVVDHNKNLKESNERNNVKVVRLKCPGGLKRKPDLTVRALFLDRRCRINVVIANVGNAGVPASAYNLPNAVGVQMYRNGKPWGGLILKGVDPTGKLKSPGTSVKHVWFPRAKNLRLKPGAHKLRVVVDNNKKLAELREHNNAMGRVVRCRRAFPVIK
jgi:hypothetical protein